MNSAYNSSTTYCDYQIANYRHASRNWIDSSSYESAITNSWFILQRSHSAQHWSRAASYSSYPTIASKLAKQIISGTHKRERERESKRVELDSKDFLHLLWQTRWNTKILNKKADIKQFEVKKLRMDNRTWYSPEFSISTVRDDSRNRRGR